MSEGLKAPERIFLCFYNYEGKVSDLSEEDVNWSTDQMETDDPEYIRKDLSDKRIKELKAQVAELQAKQPMPGELRDFLNWCNHEYLSIEKQEKLCERVASWIEQTFEVKE
jgi:hypothetical protein